MVKRIDKNAMRLKRHVRVRGKISGTPECPRLNVFRSNANIYAQTIFFLFCHSFRVFVFKDPAAL